MSYQVFVGPSKTLDIIAYVRGILEEDGATTTVPDARLASYVMKVERDFAKYINKGPLYIGNFSTNPPTSTLVTVSGQIDYSLDPTNVALGIDSGITDIVDVLYKAAGDFTAQSELAWLWLSPSSTQVWRSFETGQFSSPAARVIRDSYLNEVEKFGRGKWAAGIDLVGNLKVSIYPVPDQSGLPILIAYKSRHIPTSLGGGPPANQWYSTVPEQYAPQFADLLLATAFIESAKLAAGSKETKADRVQRQRDPQIMYRLGMRIRDEVIGAMGGTTPRAARTS